MKKNLPALLGLAMAAFAARAMAQAVFPPPEPPATRPAPYIGAGLGVAQAKTGCIGFLPGGGRDCKDTDFTWALLAGYQFNRYFGAEAEYRDLGYVTSSSATTSFSSHLTTWDAAALAFFPLGEKFSVYGKLGGYHGMLSARGAPVADRSHSGATYGAGIQYDLASAVSARLNWQRYRQVNGGDLYGVQDYDTLSGVLVWRFR
jgi:OOP family OmpA-OmpF porin